MAVDCGADICMAGALPTSKVRLRASARDYRGHHTHRDDSAHAPQASIMNDLFKHPLRSMRECGRGTGTWIGLTPEVHGGDKTGVHGEYVENFAVRQHIALEA